MTMIVGRTPNEIDCEISEYVLTPNIRFHYLINKYPIQKMTRLFLGFTKDQLDRVYKYGCLSKIFNNFKMHTVNTDAQIHEHVIDLFPLIQKSNGNYRHHSLTHFSILFCPAKAFHNYWKTHNEKIQPSNSEYIRRIIKFCTDILEFPYIKFINQSQNKALIEFCEKIVCDLISGVLLMRDGIKHTILH